MKNAYQNVHKLSKKKHILVIFVLQKTKVLIYLTKTVLKTTSNAIQHEESWLRGIVIEQVN